MRYESPTVPEGINTPRRHPLARMALLLAVVAALLLAAMFLLRLLSGWMATQIPFAWEKRLAAYHPAYRNAEHDSRGDPRVLSYLQWLAQRLVAVGGLPEGMTITIHYRDEEVVDATAGLGGHITIYRGILERAGSENALALLLAHQISHVKQRHPLATLGSGAILAAAFAAITGSTGDSLAGKTVRRLAAAAARGFSREQELQAETEALSMVYALYGHLSGTDMLYESLLKGSGDGASAGSPEFEQSHPGLKSRIWHLRRVARERGWEKRGEILALPRFGGGV